MRIAASLGSTFQTSPIWSWVRARPGLWWLLRAALVLPLFALFIYTGLRGVDFGYHWDEVDWHLEPGRLMVKSGIFLPRKYIYPSFDKWLVIWPAFPAAIRAAIENEGQALAIQAAMVADMADARYLLRARAMFIIVSSLGILWVYGAALALRYRAWQALVAAAGLGLSWEFAYHSRYAVTDCLLVQFSALTLFMLALFRRTAQPHWLYAAACAVGLSTGTKYPGVFLLAPVLVSGFLSLPWNAYFRQAWRAALLCAARLRRVSHLDASDGARSVLMADGDPWHFGILQAHSRWVHG